MGRGWRKPEPEVNIQLSRIKRERRHCATPQKTDVTAIFRESAHLNGRRMAHARVEVRGRPCRFQPVLVMMIDLLLLSPLMKRACWDSPAGGTGSARARLDVQHV